MSGPFDALVRELERLDRQVAGLGFEVGSGPLRDPRVEEVPAHLLLARAVAQHDRTMLALEAAVGGVLVPLPQLPVIRDAALEHEVRVLRLTGELHRREPTTLV